GWDFVESSIRRSERPRLQIALGSAFVAISAVIAWLWGGDILRRKIDVVYDINNAIRGLDTKYLMWKIALAICAAIALWFFARIADGSLRTVLMTVPLLLVCFVEPYFWIMRPIAHPWSQPASYFKTRAETTRVVQRESGPHERTFSLAHPYSVPAVPERGIDAPNWTALGGLEDVNGYESLIFERHSSALRSNPEADAEPFLMPNAGLLDPGNHVLDVLNVRFVTSYDDFQSAPSSRIEKEGIHFYGGDLGIDLPPSRAMTLSAPAREADTLIVVTHMAFSGHIAHGQPVARVTVQQRGGKPAVVFIRAGVDTAEWAHERADVKPVIRHGLAPVYDSAPGDAEQSFQSHRFLGRIALGGRMPVERIEIVNISDGASIGVWKASLLDSATKESWPLPKPSPSRWQAIHKKNGVTVLKNLRARPRAWLVTKVEVASKADVLATIRGTNNRPFDPATTALIEEKPQQTLSGEPCGQPCSVEIVRREPNRIAMRTNSRAPAMLVVSEIYYPGWVATVDGAKTPIHQTDYLIRGVFVPAGQHDVVMSFRPRGTIRGGIVSLCTLLLLIGGSIALRRKRQ
ncbi:MAG TPA: YfhO family protein, partial [Thermoanaerobaculia bacterium]